MSKEILEAGNRANSGDLATRMSTALDVLQGKEVPGAEMDYNANKLGRVLGLLNQYRSNPELQLATVHREGLVVDESLQFSIEVYEDGVKRFDPMEATKWLVMEYARGGTADGQLSAEMVDNIRARIESGAKGQTGRDGGSFVVPLDDKFELRVDVGNRVGGITKKKQQGFSFGLRLIGESESLNNVLSVRRAELAVKLGVEGLQPDALLARVIRPGQRLRSSRVSVNPNTYSVAGFVDTPSGKLYYPESDSALNTLEELEAVMAIVNKDSEVYKQVPNVDRAKRAFERVAEDPRQGFSLMVEPNTTGDGLLYWVNFSDDQMKYRQAEYQAELQTRLTAFLQNELREATKEKPWEWNYSSGLTTSLRRSGFDPEEVKPVVLELLGIVEKPNMKRGWGDGSYTLLPNLFQPIKVKLDMGKPVQWWQETVSATFVNGRLREDSKKILIYPVEIPTETTTT